MKLLRLIVLCIISTLSFQCSEEGSVGPQGPQGIQGEIGPSGENGSIIHADSGAPDSDLGNNGDYYLDKDTGELYGPKLAESGWGVPISLGSTDGSDGSDGSQIFAGNAAPSPSTGKNGDYYLNKTTFDLYGPKASGNWGTPINLKGTANVMYSSWIAADWNLTDLPRYKAMKIPVNQLDHNDTRNKAAVLMYLSQWGSSLIYPMPNAGRWSNTFYSYGFGDNGVALHKSIYIELRSTNGVDLEEFQYAGFRGNRFRYVIIPGGIPTSSGRLEGTNENAPPINYNDYEAVKKYYGIRD